MTIEIVDFPINSMVIFHSFLYVYQRVMFWHLSPFITIDHHLFSLPRFFIDGHKNCNMGVSQVENGQNKHIADLANFIWVLPT